MESPKKKSDHSIHSCSADSSSISAGISTVSENFRRFRLVPSRIIIPPSFYINEPSKKHNGGIKEKAPVKPSAKFFALKKKKTSHKTNNFASRESKKSTTSDLNHRSHCTENTLNSAEKRHTRFNSLMDGKKRRSENNDAIFSPSFVKQNTSTLTPSETLNFNNTNANHRNHHLKEFDLIRYGDISEGLVKRSENERVFSLVPKVLPSAPVILPMRKYSRGILLVKDPKDTLYETKENNEKDIKPTPVKIEFENTRDRCSPKESETGGSLRDNEDLNGAPFEKDDNYVLIVKKPIRIKCIDEASNKIKDIIIYSDDFYKAILKEKGYSASKKEIYESVLKESRDCKTKNLRIVTDAEKYFCILHSNRESRGDIKSTTSKIPKRIQTKFSKQVLQTKKKSSNVPPCNESSETAHFFQPRKKESLAKQNTTLKNETDVSVTQADKDSHLAKNKITKSTKILKRQNKKFVSMTRSKSRTALKRMNIGSIIESEFSYYFNCYAKLGRPLKSGVAISKKNSTDWLKTCGIVSDEASKNMVEKCFMTVAKAKCVLNICDYIKCLNKIAVSRRMLLVDILYKMMSGDLPSVKKSGVKQMENRQNESTVQDSTPQAKQTAKSKKVLKNS